MPDFSSFRVLLDEPEAEPALGFDGYAEALTELVLHTTPQFAIALYGVWGTGKTTLMRAVERRLREDPGAICVWFNAWRYEREPHLVVPLLDNLREQLAVYAREGDQAERQSARRAAAMVARAAKAIAAGTTLEARIPAVGGLNVDAGKAMKAWHDGRRSVDEPVSFYHASFRAMLGAVEEFITEGRRIVVFVDDLDRCLAEGALQVLEGMKLLFDFRGFVFVVGLDQKVVEALIDARYAMGNGSVADQQTRKFVGRDYMKKLFQVTFSMPPLAREQLDSFFRTLLGPLPEEQRSHLSETFAPHLDSVAGGGPVNPREIKRFVNAYTLQMKVLSKRFAAPNAHVVIALQTMNFRPDWVELYESLSTDPELFRGGLLNLAAVAPGQEAWAGDVQLPQSFVDYVRGPAAALATEANLADYVAAAESTRSSDPRLLDAQSSVAKLRRQLLDLGSQGSTLTEADAWSQAKQVASRLTELLPQWHFSTRAADALATLAQIDIALALPSPPPPSVPAERPPWADPVVTRLVAIEGALTAIRRESTLAPTATA